MIIYVIYLLFIASSVNAISGGHDTNITRRHKWQLSLQHDNQHFCGAILIASTWALTSAGCVQLHPTGLSVCGGSSYTSSGGQVVDVQSIVVHPDYNATTHDSDIALLQFSEEMNDTVTITVSMPFNDYDVEDYKGTTLTGWGSLGNGTQPEVLQMLHIPVTPSEKCQSAYPETVINSNMFCTGWMMKNQDRTACEGDYGGPGVIEARLQGIISWGKGCGVEKYPTVLTRVSNYMYWIKETTGIDFAYYPFE